MTLSFWRYSHLLLAISASLFLVLASVSGAILAFEPISDALRPYHVAEIKEVTAANVIEVLQEKYGEVLEIKRTSAHAVIATVVTKEGNSTSFYVYPLNGEILGEVKGKSPFFTFVTNLHRSLFLKSTGRFFVGLISLLLCFIAVTGMLLLLQRQGGVRKFFSKVKDTDFAQRYHVIFGKWLFMPILIIAATGVYLSLEKFSVLPSENIQHQWDFNSAAGNTVIPVSQMEVFNEVDLGELRSLSFPFSEDPEDYYQMALKDRELLVHQYTGEIVSEIAYPFTKLASDVSLKLHTGQGSVLWSVVLFLASIGLLFFIYSGFAMLVKRRRKSRHLGLVSSRENSEFIILVGSETGNTFEMAKIFCKALQDAGKTVFLSTLNQYTTYARAKHLIVFTATYGDGDPPSNARKFEELFPLVKPKGPLQFAVVGLGSREYPNFCHFAIKIDTLLREHPSFKPILPLFKIHEQSQSGWENWKRQWTQSLELSLTFEGLPAQKKKQSLEKFVVIGRSDLNVDDTFLLELRPKRSPTFQSGDLLGVLPKGEKRERQYSIAKKEGHIVLSIKKHSHGICSSFLNEINRGEEVMATLTDNQKFHFPEEAPATVCIANGTGIGPFLGMIAENKTQTPIHLFWGGRTKKSWELYGEQLDWAISKKQLVAYQIAYSQEPPKQYVQAILLREGPFLAKTLADGGIFMICGSLAMQDSVLLVLEEICKKYLNRELNEFEHKGQLLMDCY
ncbi:PepSY domain-containing protein [Spongiimicrobium salis]|uniref:PepSY domain-containing protein n=1 Tax=Spongiimicrobium salis TaxID=1667022 RepID=UPI00374D197B